MLESNSDKHQYQEHEIGIGEFMLAGAASGVILGLRRVQEVISKVGTGATRVADMGVGVGIYLADELRGSEQMDAIAISHSRVREDLSVKHQNILDGVALAQSVHEDGAFVAEIIAPALVQSASNKVGRLWRRYVDDGSQYFNP